MKKALSLFMAMVMALPVFSGIGIQAFAAVPESAVFKSAKPMELVKDVDVFWYEDDDGESHFAYYCLFSNGDTVTVNMSDGSKVDYIFNEEDYDFYDKNGSLLNYNIESSLDEEFWDIGSHSFLMSVYDEDYTTEITVDIPVTLIENPVAGAEFIFSAPDVSVITITENTMGWWDTDDGENYYYNYDLAYSFEEGCKIVVKMKDGSSVVYTNKLFEFPEEAWSYTAFADEEGNELNLVQEYQNAENHWGVGRHTAVFHIDNLGVSFEIPVEIVKGSQETCWHEGDWKTVNGLQVKRCVGCGYEVVIPFKDIQLYKSYSEYIAYTSVHNRFIAGTNPPKYTLFSPKTAITRAMLIAILYRMAGNPYDGAKPHKSNPFSDVKENAYYYNAACWALDEGITNQKTFKPNDNVTREQTARMLFAYAESKGLLGDDDYLNVDLSDYPDYNDVHPWAVEPLKWANYNDMITGTQQGYINPQGATQRIHATRILYGFGYICDIGNFG